MDCSPPGSVRGILQARILEWVATSFSKGIFLTQRLNPSTLRCRQIVCIALTWALGDLGLPRLQPLYRRSLAVWQWEPLGSPSIPGLYHLFRQILKVPTGQFSTWDLSGSWFAEQNMGESAKPLDGSTDGAALPSL